MSTDASLELGRKDLREFFSLKYGDPARTGWVPRMRLGFGYYSPDDHYEAIVARLVGEGTEWLDVGTGRDLFPSNRALARELADRARVLVGVDPDATLDENPFVHEKVRSTLEDYRADRQYDLITLRMVAEHVTDPQSLVRSLAVLARPGAHVVIYTVNKWSPGSVISKIAPFRLHHPVKRILWGTEEKDTFPVAYRMNTRRRLRSLFEANRFRERHFTYLDDCRSLARFRSLQFLELTLWRALSALGLRYPENCLLGVYQRR